jgi:hypothetical protein
MKKTKMSLANIQGKLSRAEMKSIMAGSGTDCADNCTLGNTCFFSGPEGCGTATVVGSNGQGGCEWQVSITEPPPCGWA